MLCDSCENIQYDNLDQEPDDSGYAGHPHHAELKSCSSCDFCKIVTTDIASNAALKVNTEWQEQRIYLRVFPSSTAIDESEKSNLLVYSSPWQENGRDQTTLAIYGLFVERTETELKEGKP
jgi:hypothetical protein